MTILPVEDYLAEVDPKLFVNPMRDMYIDLASGMTGPIFGDFRNYAIALRASHEYTTGQGDQEATGLITGKSEGRASISYWNTISKGSTSTFSTTKNGKKLKALMNQLGIKASVGDTQAVL